MSKPKEELDALKEEVEAVNEKLNELTEEEIAQVNGGVRSGCSHYGLPAIGRSGDESVDMMGTHMKRVRAPLIK